MLIGRSAVLMKLWTSSDALCPAGGAAGGGATFVGPRLRTSSSKVLKSGRRSAVLPATVVAPESAAPKWPFDDSVATVPLYDATSNVPLNEPEPETMRSSDAVNASVVQARPSLRVIWSLCAPPPVVDGVNVRLTPGTRVAAKPLVCVTVSVEAEAAEIV